MAITLRLAPIVVAAILVVSACSDDDGGDAADDGPTAAPATTEPSDETPTSGTTATGDEPSSTTGTTGPTDATDSAPPPSDVEATCSASGVERPGPQRELPAPVAEKREAILTAALACDLDALAALTGPSFTASFGGGDPVEIWNADEEDFGNEPMRALVEILRLAPTTGESGTGGIAYTWPPAFGYPTWEDVPEADREALRVLYDDADFEGFAQFGGYIGYRTTIAEDGTWTVFVAGD